MKTRKMITPIDYINVGDSIEITKSGYYISPILKSGLDVKKRRETKYTSTRNFVTTNRGYTSNFSGKVIHIDTDRYTLDGQYLVEVDIKYRDSKYGVWLNRCDFYKTNGIEYFSKLVKSLKEEYNRKKSDVDKLKEYIKVNENQLRNLQMKEVK
jgi:hypothetical protein